MKWLYASALACFLLFTTSAMGQRPQISVGDSVSITGYCLSERETVNLTMIMATEGVPGVITYLKQPDNDCQSMLMGQLSAPIRVIILEKVWVVTTLEGVTVQFWKIKGRQGTIGYTWTILHQGQQVGPDDWN